MDIIESNLKFNSNYSIRQDDPNGIVLHHAASSGSVEDVHNYHLSLGWAGIGYHFYVRKDGSIYAGRPEDWIGAHTTGHNEKIGICAEGDFEKEKMGAAQKNAIIWLLEYLREKYGPLEVFGHRHLDVTACPGKNYPFSEIVKGKPLPDPDAVTVTLTTLGKGDEGEQVKALQRLLAGLGYDLGGFGADGIFGNATDRDVRSFQQGEGLTVDGLVGYNTWSHLLGIA